MKETVKKYDIPHIFYNDTLWVTFFLINVLYSLGQIMVKYNYSSVSDTNPISIAIHAGIYLVGVVFVLKILTEWRCVRCALMEVAYFILKVFILLPNVSATFSYLFIARAICILAGAVMGHTVFRNTYLKIKKEPIAFNAKIVVPTVGLGFILFVIVYHRYILQMAFGLFILWFLKAMLAGGGGDYVSSPTGTAGSSSGGSSYDGYGYGCSSSYSSENSGQERIAFSQYDFTRGNIADDIDRIDF